MNRDVFPVTKAQNFTADNTDYTDLRGSKKFNIRPFEFAIASIRGEICFWGKALSYQPVSTKMSYAIRRKNA